MAVKHPEKFLRRASINITLDTHSHVIEGKDGDPVDATDDAL